MKPTHHKTRGGFARSERGATAIEYGLITALVFLGLVGGFTMFANTTTNMFSKITSSVGSSR